MENNCKIVDYTREYRDSFGKYLHKIYPNKSDAYIDYCLDRSSDREPTKLVINQNNAIVGCHQFFCTKALVKEEEIDTQWGHDTYLDEEYRRSFGMEFMLYIEECDSKCRGFGLGLTAINDKIQRILKKVYFRGVYNYYLVNFKFFLSPFQKMFNIEPDEFKGKSIKVGKTNFIHIDDVTNMTIPDNGYWNKGRFTLDFVRDEMFINQRFLQNTVFDYYLFASDSERDPCYFVVRKTKYRGFPAITISDFRYKNPEMARLIIKAAQKFAKKSNCGVLLFIGGDSNIDKEIKKWLHYKTPIDFVANRHFPSDLTFCITGADSDADFLK
jgi:hypothetical protein